jgi:hypothetical protein
MPGNSGRARGLAGLNRRLERRSRSRRDPPDRVTNHRRPRGSLRRRPNMPSLHRARGDKWSQRSNPTNRRRQTHRPRTRHPRRSAGPSPGSGRRYMSRCRKVHCTSRSIRRPRRRSETFLPRLHFRSACPPLPNPQWRPPRRLLRQPARRLQHRNLMPQRRRLPACLLRNSTAREGRPSREAVHELGSFYAKSMTTSMIHVS